jgi:hypothetical protein
VNVQALHGVVLFTRGFLSVSILRERKRARIALRRRSNCR